MTTNKMTFDNFQAEKLTKTQQKTVRGGDTVVVDPTDPKYDPTKGGGAGNG
ncbi:rSAM-modified peptide [Flavobacterium branchiicola]|uniref:RSAM-modified peptide n=1 Tax=Flavobacterium branchiicola TaxID=1114875 RepID=A0ABV9PDY4_9FLAO|nr:rSAM-modified peptide [Flavobacterium branchiicola]MBS7254949.1 rSAM-modified peptide [Flavobacterium branchiicola]